MRLKRDHVEESEVRQDPKPGEDPEVREERTAIAERDDVHPDDVSPPSQEPEQVAAPAPNWRRPLLDRPIVRSGIFAWGVVGLILVALAGLYVLDLLRIIVVPFVLALFPAAILAPLSDRLKRVTRPAPAALLTMLVFFGVVGGAIALLAPQVMAEVDGLVEEAQRGAEEVRAFLEEGPLGFDPIPVNDLLQQIQDRIQNTEGLSTTALGWASAVAEGVAGFFLLLVVLFFYLKDGPLLGRWLKSLFPPRVQDDAEEIGVRTWQTVGGYIRGQLIVALVDAVLIGLAIALLGVPLALPLAVLVFFGGLFPIVGAVLSGLIAVLVALATNGLVTALILLAIIIAVQQLEGDLLAPIVLGRAVKLHPLAVLASLAAGGVLLGILGAFIAVPVVASATKAVAYLRQRVPG